MTKKDYECAASIVQDWCDNRPDNVVSVKGNFVEASYVGEYITDAFVSLFRDDNPHFDEARFRAACVPGANVKARPRKVKVS